MIPPTPRRDLIVITIDTLRADRLGIAGYPLGVTPGLDELGRRGAVFLDATAHAPLTLPSHSSIFTGRYPPGHGVHDNSGFALASGVPTLAEMLHDSGYHTAAFVSTFVLRGTTGLSRGFDLYDDRFTAAGRAHQTVSALERPGPEVAREAARWLAAAQRPYFLWVHFYDPHAPYDPPPVFAERFPGRPYDGEVATSDFGVSEVLRALSPDRRADTLIVATGDHGESLGEHGESEHGVLLYDAALHVPLIIAGPGVDAGLRVQRQVRHVDLLPTIVDLLGVNPPSAADGVSLVPLLRGVDAKSRPRGATGPTEEAPVSYAESRFGELHFGWTPLRSVRDGTWKYISGADPELFHLSADPGERDDLRASHAGTAVALARALSDLVARAGPRSSAAAADVDTMARLRSLGYVSGRVALDAPDSRGGRSGNADGSGPDPKREIARYEAYVKAFNDGLGRLESGRAQNAETIFRRLAHDFPLAFEPHQYLARALAARLAFSAAIAELDVAVRLNPREPALYFDEARTLADDRQFERAFARVAEGRRLDPVSYSGALTEGLVARAAGLTDRAARAFDESIRMNPRLGIAHLELGAIAESRGDRDTARREYQLALDGDATLVAAREALERMKR